MNEFTALRARAKTRRDKAIAYAKSEYESALVQIATLEQSLLGKRSTKHKSISSSIQSVLPRSEPFTALDVLTSLEALDPSRNWRKRSVDYCMTKLRERGLVRRLKRATIHEPAVYVRSDSNIEPEPLADTTLPEVIRSVLVRPMTTTETMVAVLEAGYRSSMKQKNLRQHASKRCE